MRRETHFCQVTSFMYECKKRNALVSKMTNFSAFQESDSAHSYCGHPLTMDLSDQVDLFIVTIICSTDLFSTQYQCHNSHPEPYI